MADLVEVATLAEVPVGHCKHVEVGGRPIALFNVGGTIYATHGECTHRGGRLGEGELAGTEVICPLHGATFDVTTGQVTGPPAPENIPTYRVVLQGEAIKVELP
jgi:nitrite reductase/ring-hydroxylating ferredoxin subunit